MIFRSILSILNVLPIAVDNFSSEPIGVAGISKSRMVAVICDANSRILYSSSDRSDKSVHTAGRAEECEPGF
jgi:hypothetical protein